ncbi:DNA-processing protein DprA [Rickettsia endosymbiont of Cardiosporidium cionae]|uniref:DNA-processing protein DprA n=1 Tax=Rickettsia endosymbiont of Cardiosporidium cionae TaxID=2777155 RepID=UPI0018944AFC|nr:DNA-processing protein DprA [Rickettsia endosymbiont of Cardiosporidium cionae]KAF8818813.1 DNA-protecting protein DprA [Rickettsia endosymbiont of Cardiosporidium cionae]
MFKNLFQNSTQKYYSKEDISILRLIRSENVGPRTFALLIRMFNSAEIALENIAEFSLRGGRSNPIKVYSEKDAFKEIKKLDDNNSKFITYTNPDYPKLLLETHSYPPLLTYNGNIQLANRKKIISVVGARNCSMNGRILTRKIISELVSEGFVTVSGLAIGIDTEVHQSSIENTIAIIAGGIDNIYPSKNAELFHTLSKNSLIISESPIGTKALSKNFHQRNRIISGISLGTLVIEAKTNSGSLSTANFALEQNREVFVVPGFPLDPRYSGSNKLIKNGEGMLIESSQDIINNLSPVINLLSSNQIFDDNILSTQYRANNMKMINITDKDRKIVIDSLSATPIKYSSIPEYTNLSIQQVATICLELELAGKIYRDHCNNISLIYE